MSCFARPLSFSLFVVSPLCSPSLVPSLSRPLSIYHECHPVGQSLLDGPRKSGPAPFTFRESSHASRSLSRLLDIGPAFFSSETMGTCTFPTPRERSSAPSVSRSPRQSGNDDRCCVILHLSKKQSVSKLLPTSTKKIEMFSKRIHKRRDVSSHRESLELFKHSSSK